MVSGWLCLQVLFSCVIIWLSFVVLVLRMCHLLFYIGWRLGEIQETGGKVWRRECLPLHGPSETRSSLGRTTFGASAWLVVPMTHYFFTQLENEEQKKQRLERFGDPDITSMSTEVSKDLLFFFVCLTVNWNSSLAHSLSLFHLSGTETEEKGAVSPRQQLKRQTLCCLSPVSKRSYLHLLYPTLFPPILVHTTYIPVSTRNGNMLIVYTVHRSWYSSENSTYRPYTL